MPGPQEHTRTGLTPPGALLDLIGDAHGSLHPEALCHGLLTSLSRAVPSDWISINDLDARGGRSTVLIEPPFSPGAHRQFARLAHENPLLVRYQRTGDGRAYRFSDVVAAVELHTLGLYREFYGPIGLEHQVAFTLTSGPDRVLAVALSRRHRDYTDDERDLLNLARPYLIQAYRNAVEHARVQAELLDVKADFDRARSTTRLDIVRRRLRGSLLTRGLTSREAEVISLIATGQSGQTVAQTLGITEPTVRKHLERAYRKLNVTNRSDAATVAWTLID